MTDCFKPQETTLKTFHEVETNLFNSFRSAGFEDEQARTVAHTFTQYTLGYFTIEGVAKRFLDANIPEPVARNLLVLFEQVGRKAADRIPAARSSRRRHDDLAALAD